MDKDRIEGKVDDVKGRVKRQAGEWTGNSELQAEGAIDQAKGKVQNAFGKMKDAARDSMDDANDQGEEGQVRRKDENAA